MAPRVSLVMPREGQHVAVDQTIQRFQQQRFPAIAEPPGEPAQPLVTRWR